MDLGFVERLDQMLAKDRNGRIGHMRQVAARLELIREHHT